ncbi:hypothetical protein RSP673_019290 (plasmid) [Ralstonia solanacearum P673]|uniref:hypothetical protein n=1 Tax=Ralstonia solanacearum TaxID=305 RepID=UPI002029DCC1|nr:hypothetical protein [Ralstonia solanacearum]MCL9849317.1 hypothetical protein [Ralstonia solanacearum]MCL9856038.1 hypothetical protein [Ralstonia solanacearum]MCL9861523.1 hypothetical protein [Ralstonia solanacearum]MCL9865784.1 hypothetical protein [Ralstonia solanacearum]MCL9870554.1 hypothetical protein [Ralstonia solanacearum]
MKMSNSRRWWTTPLSIGLVTVVLTGCAFMQALSVEPSKHPASAQQPGGITVVLARARSADSTLPQVADSDLTPAQISLRQEAGSHCAPEPSGKTPQLAPIAVPIVEVVSSIAISATANEIQSYIDSEKVKFAPPALSLTQNIHYLWESSSKTPTFTCIMVGLQRAVDNPKSKAEAVKWDSVAVLALVPSNDGVEPALYKLRPTYFRLARSGALTTIPPSSDGKIDPSKGSGLVTTVVGFSLTAAGIAAKSTTVDAKVALSKAKLPTCDSDNVDSCHQPTEWSLDDEKSRAQLIASETPWFALPGRGKQDTSGKLSCTTAKCTPVTVTVSLTQVGNGSPDFDRAKSELSDDAKALAAAIDKIIEAQAAK